MDIGHLRVSEGKVRKMNFRDLDQLSPKGKRAAGVPLSLGVPWWYAASAS